MSLQEIWRMKRAANEASKCAFGIGAREKMVQRLPETWPTLKVYPINKVTKIRLVLGDGPWSVAHPCC
jgi:hypothetical protein